MPEAFKTDLNDAALVKLAKSGDTEAFEVLYQQNAANIYRFLCAQLKETLDAEDLTSEVFMKAWRGLPRYRDRGHPFSAYLYKIARNALIDHRRKNSKQVFEANNPVESILDSNPKVSEQLHKKEAHQNLWRLLREIKENYQSVLVLRFINGLSTSEVAQILGKSEGSIRVLQHRGLNALREIMAESNGEL
jgi:RNA polymerase sigma-70 factor (ECF subfamily)